MSTKARRAESVPGGWMVQYEIENAYVNGESRIEHRFVPLADLAADKTEQERINVLKATIDYDPLDGIRDTPLGVIR